MDQNETRIDELKSRIKENQAELKEVFQEAGERIAGEKLYTGDDESILKLLQNVDESLKDLENIDGRMDDLRSSYNRISEIAEREKEIGEEYAVLEKENRTLFGPLGQSAFSRLKENQSGEYGKVYKILIETEEKIKEQDDQIFRLESSGVKKGLFEGIKNKSRIAFLKSGKKRLESTMNSHFVKLGEKIYKKDPEFLDSLGGDSISAFASNRTRMAELDGEISRLKEENSTIEKHLKSEYNSSRQKKTEEKMQSQRDLALSARMAGLNELGAYVYREKTLLDDRKLTDLFKSADTIHEDIEKLDREIEQLKAEIEIKNLEDEVVEMKNSIKDLELTIEKCTGDIAEFNSEIKRARAEIRKLKKIAQTDAGGNEAT